MECYFLTILLSVTIIIGTKSKQSNFGKYYSDTLKIFDETLKLYNQWTSRTDRRLFQTNVLKQTFA